MSATLFYTILAIQAITFLALGALFLASGHIRLGIAQLLLALVQLVIYSEPLS